MATKRLTKKQREELIRKWDEEEAARKAAEKALKAEFRKYGITARKYEGDDSESWAVFRNGQPTFTGMNIHSVNYYKKLTLRIAKGEV